MSPTMELLYLDCFSGISGDMFMGAMLDLGLPFMHLKEELGRLKLSGYSLSAAKEIRRHLAGTRFLVEVIEHHHHPHRTFADIESLITSSALHDQIKDLSLSIFRLLAEAEGRVHRVSPSAVTFHEVGAVDSIVDIVGAAAACAYFGFPRIVSSPLPLGQGYVSCAHGLLPVPAPATLEIVCDRIPTASPPVSAELVTPTGAALVACLAESFGPLPAMRIARAGYGVGTAEFKEVPNLLRIVGGQALDNFAHDEVTVIETHVDDMNPQLYAPLMEALLAAGALDVSFTPMQMKKQRPAIKITVVSRPNEVELLAGIIFRESSAIGLRYYPCRRLILNREEELVETPWGQVRVKISRDRSGRILNSAPEYEDLKRIAEEKKVPIKQVIDAVAGQKKWE